MRGSGCPGSKSPTAGRCRAKSPLDLLAGKNTQWCNVLSRDSVFVVAATMAAAILPTLAPGAAASQPSAVAAGRLVPTARPGSSHVLMIHGDRILLRPSA